MHFSYRQILGQVKGCPYTLAAPSWVWPGTVADNCQKLAGIFPEVSLMFLEAQACLAYGRKDLPPDLAGLPLRWHVHLPIDLDWPHGAKTAMESVEALARKAAFLSPWSFVLHPPPGGAKERRALLAEVSRLWRDAGREPRDLLLENTRDAGPVELLALSRDLGFGLCLDLGHIMAYEQALPALRKFAGQVRMLHLNAPGPKAGHLPLTRLSPDGKGLLRGLLEAAGRDAVLTLEIFEPQGLFDSVGWLAHAIEEWSL
jgi:hypothetical protein